MSVLERRLGTVRERVAAAAGRARRDPNEIEILAVSKTQLPELIREAIGAGQVIFGENKVQEAESKIAELGRDGIKWHMIGHLQSNKARKAVQLFDVIQSLDSIELAQRLNRVCVDEGRGELSVMIQVDLAGEETKSGIPESELDGLVDFLRGSDRLKLKGLMILPPYFEDPEATRPYFRRLCEIRDGIIPDGQLSMGMSHDFEVAIEEGATIVRVGTAIFGERAYN